MRHATPKRLVFAGMIALATIAVSVDAQPHGRGMMHGPGMMDGPGTMDGYGGMGPGMMMDHGMGMMGPGMMMGHGMGMMGPGMMMGGYGSGWMAGLDLTAQQQERVAEIRQHLMDKQWEHMRQMRQQMPAMWQAYRGEKIDVDAVMQAHEAMMAAGHAMLRQRLEAQNDIRDLLTEEQRTRLRHDHRCGPGRGEK